MKKLIILTLFFFSVCYAQIVKDVTVYRGDSTRIEFRANGNITTKGIVFVVKLTKAFTSPRLIQKKNLIAGGSAAEIIATFSAPQTKVTVILGPDDTQDLTGATYYYDIVAADAGALTSYSTFNYGIFKVIQDVQTPFDGTALPEDGTRITTVSLANGTLQNESIAWDTTLNQWVPAGFVFSTEQTVAIDSVSDALKSELLADEDTTDFRAYSDAKYLSVNTVLVDTAIINDLVEAGIEPVINDIENLNDDIVRIDSIFNTKVDKDSVQSWEETEALIGQIVEDSLKTYYVNSRSEITSSLATNSYVKIKSTNATYKITATPVSGFTTDGVLQISLGGGKYAIYQPKNDAIIFSEVMRTDGVLDDTEQLENAANFRYANLSTIAKIIIDTRVYVTDEIIFPLSVWLDGTPVLGAYSNANTYKETTNYIYLYINDISKNGLRFAGGMSRLTNLSIVIMSNVDTAISISSSGYSNIFENVTLTRRTGTVNCGIHLWGNSMIASVGGYFNSVNYLHIDGVQGSGLVIDGMVIFRADNLRIMRTAQSTGHRALSINGGVSYFLKNLWIEDIFGTKIYANGNSHLEIEGGYFEVHNTYGTELLNFDINNCQLLSVKHSVLTLPMNLKAVNTSIFESNYFTGYVSTDSLCRSITLMNNTVSGFKNLFDSYMLDYLHPKTKYFEFGTINKYGSQTIGTEIFPLPESKTNRLDISDSKMSNNYFEYTDEFIDTSFIIRSPYISIKGTKNLIRYSEKLINSPNNFLIPSATTNSIGIANNDTLSPTGEMTAEEVQYVYPSKPVKRIYLQLNTAVIDENLEPLKEYTFSFYARTTYTQDTVKIQTYIEKPLGNIFYDTLYITSSWERHSYTFQVTENVNVKYLNLNFISPYPDSGTGFFIWGTQLERGSFATEYIKTDGASLNTSVTITGNLKFESDSIKINDLQFKAPTPEDNTGLDDNTIWKDSLGYLRVNPSYTGVGSEAKKSFFIIVDDTVGEGSSCFAFTDNSITIDSLVASTKDSSFYISLRYSDEYLTSTFGTLILEPTLIDSISPSSALISCGDIVPVNSYLKLYITSDSPSTTIGENYAIKIYYH